MLNEGMYIADRYEIVGRVGTGGMSDVYKAKDHTLGRNVAIKVLKSEFSEDMNFVTKFRTEAQSAAGLEHPNIVNIYDVGSENGIHYIVEEYVEGITLKDYIEKKGRLNYKEALSIAIQVSRGIQAAHEKNIIHRDIKPQNIIISTDGKVKVTDFGIAKAASENTIHSDVMGSVHYASPEQARNGYVSQKSDIYSLGIVMYEMVTGKVPFTGESTVAVAIQHLQDEMVTPAAYADDLPVSLEKIILKCTQKSPDRRYDTVENLLIDLRKSLISPNEDFVTMVPLNKDDTRVISDDELKSIHENTAPIEADGSDEEVEEDNGKFLNPKMEKVVTIMGIVAAIVIVIIVVLILANMFDLFKTSKTTTNTSTTSEAQTDSVEMIDVTGMTIDGAEVKLEDLGLKIHQSGTEASTDYKEGEIISQDVEEGDSVAKGTTVNVVVSSGEQSTEESGIDVPDVVGKSSDTAMSAIEAVGLTATREFEYSDSVDAGYVIRQSPEAGSSAQSNDTVTIYVSQGKETVKVPSVKGLTEASAKSKLKAAGLKVSTSSEYSDTVEKGSVISQSVSSGKYVAKGTTVKIVVSKGTKTVTYSYKASLSAPTNVTVQYATIKLYEYDSDDVIKSWSKVTTFPYSVSVTGIKDVSSGTLVITWYYTDADGNTQSDVQEKEVTFTKVS